MQLIDELIGYTKANADAARSPDDTDVWMAHHRNCVRVKAEIELLRAALTKCANKLERCAIAGGTNAEYAAIAVKEFRDLAE